MRPKQQPDFQVTIAVKVDRKSLENAKCKIQSNIYNSKFWVNCFRCGSIYSRDVRGGAFSSGAGRGDDENPRGGAKMKIRGAVRGGAGQKSA